MEKKLTNNFKLSDEKSVDDKFREFIDECYGDISAIKSQNKHFIPVKVKRTIQVILKKIHEMKMKAIRNLKLEQGNQKVHDDFEFAEIDSFFASRLTTAFVTKIKHIDLNKFLIASKKKTIMNHVNDALIIYIKL